MKSIKILVALLLLSVLTPAMSQQYDASGVWRSTTGYVFRIPASTQYFDLNITSPQGQTMRGQGQWVQKGHSFTYTVSGMSGSAFVSYNSQYDALEVRGPSGTSWWRRVSH
jgi:hypothetical protein